MSLENPAFGSSDENLAFSSNPTTAYSKTGAPQQISPPPGGWGKSEPVTPEQRKAIDDLRIKGLLK